MVRTKKMNENLFVKMQKDLTAAGELIRARQDEKQSLLNEFDQECKRFFFGKISQKALMSSIRKTNKELQRLDKSLRETIKKAKDTSKRESTLISNQAPIVYKATLSGLSGGNAKPKKVKKAVKKKVKKSSTKKVSKPKAKPKAKAKKTKKIVRKKK